MSMSDISFKPSLRDLMPRRDNGVGWNVIQGTALGVVLTVLSYVVGLHFGWLDAVNYLEAFAVFTSYLCTYLCVMERRINYPIGAISTAAYCILFLQASLLSSMAVNAYLTVYLIYGWYRWRSDANSLPVTHINLRWGLVSLLIAATGYAVVVGLTLTFGGAVVFTDSAVLVGTLIAQFMLDNKQLENWWVWLVMNLFAIYTYATAGLALAAFQYVFFAANAVYGWYMWRKSMRTIEPEPTIQPIPQAV